MKISYRLKSFVFAAFIVPTTSLNDWKIEEFSSGPKNEFTATEKGMLVKVNNSAGPLFYILQAKEKVIGFKIVGEFQGLPKFSEPLRQGEKGFDDFPLRLGFIIPGEKKLTGVKKMFAAKWVKRLYEQVPEGTGIDSVRFFNVTQNAEKLNHERAHPSADLLHEYFFAEVKQAGPFSYEFTLKEPIEAVALWLSIDGDDTKSKYDVLISSLELRLQ